MIGNSSLQGSKISEALTTLCSRLQVPYNYALEVTNRFKALDLIECLKNYGWKFVVQEAVIKTTSKKRNAKRQNGCLRRPYKQL